MKKLLTLSILTVLFSGAIFAQPMFNAQNANGQFYGMPGQMLKVRLNLTDEQAQKINDIITAQRQDALDTRLEIQKLRLEIRKIYLSDNPDYNKVKELNAQISELFLKQRNRRVDTRSKISEILTPEQKKLWSQMPYGFGPRGAKFGRKGFGARGFGGRGMCGGYGMGPMWMTR